MTARSQRLALAAFFAVAWVMGTAAAAPGKKSRKSATPAGQQDDTEKPKEIDTSTDEPTRPPSEFAVPAPVRTAADDEALAPKKKDYTLGMGARARWITIPAGFLKLFTDNNVPLSSFGLGVELYRRRNDMDIVVGFAYQNMSPPDGNWLGKGYDATIDTDYLQFKGLGFVGVDVSFVFHYDFNEFIGFHYGAGIGVAAVTGKILRTSSTNCTASTVGDLAYCRPSVCTGPSGCTDAELAPTDGTQIDDAPNDPHRFKETSVPPIIPILNMLIGLNLHVPQAKGLEIRIEGGIYNALFLGVGMSYPF